MSMRLGDRRRFACGCVRSLPNSGGLGAWIYSCAIHVLADLRASQTLTFPRPSEQR